MEITIKGEISKLNVGPGDTIVLSCDQHLSQEQMRLMRENLLRVLGTTQRILILDKTMTIGVLSKLEKA